MNARLDNNAVRLLTQKAWQADILKIRDIFHAAGDKSGYLAWIISLSSEDGQLLLEGLRERGEI